MVFDTKTAETVLELGKSINVSQVVVQEREDEFKTEEVVRKTAQPEILSQEALEQTMVQTHMTAKHFDDKIVFDTKTAETVLELGKSVNVTQVVHQEQEEEYKVEEVVGKTAQPEILSQEPIEQTMIQAQMTVKHFDDKMVLDTKTAETVLELGKSVNITQVVHQEQESEFKPEEITEKTAQPQIPLQESVEQSTVQVQMNVKHFDDKVVLDTKIAETVLELGKSVNVTQVILQEREDEFKADEVVEKTAQPQIPMQESVQQSMVQTHMNVQHFDDKVIFDTKVAETILELGKSVTVTQIISQEQEDEFRTDEITAKTAQTQLPVQEPVQQSVVQSHMNVQEFDDKIVFDTKTAETILELGKSVSVTQVVVQEHEDEFTAEKMLGKTAQTEILSQEPIEQSIVQSHMTVQQFDDNIVFDTKTAETVLELGKSVSVTQVIHQEQEDEFKPHEFVSKQAQPEILSQESVQQSTVQTHMHVQHFKDKSPEQTFAQFTQEQMQGVIISESLVQEREKTFETIQDIETKVQIGITGVKAASVSETIPSDREGILPKEFKAPELTATKDVTVQEIAQKTLITTQSTVEELTTKAPAFEQGQFTQTPLETISVSESTVIEKEGQFETVFKPDSTMANILLDEQKSVTVTQVISDDKEKEYVHPTKPQTQKADKSILSITSLQQSEIITLDSTEGIPDKVKTEPKTAIKQQTTFESLVQTTISTSEKEETLKVTPIPESASALMNLQVEQEITVTEVVPQEQGTEKVVTGFAEEVAKPDVVERQVAVKTETLSEDTFEEFKTDKVGEMTLKSSLPAQQHSLIVTELKSIGERESVLPDKTKPSTRTASLSLEQSETNLQVTEVVAHDKEGDITVQDIPTSKKITQTTPVQEPLVVEQTETQISEEQFTPENVPYTKADIKEVPDEINKVSEETEVKTKTDKVKKKKKLIKEPTEEKPTEEEPIVEEAPKEEPKEEKPKKVKPKLEKMTLEQTEVKPTKLKFSEPKEDVPLFAQIKLKKQAPKQKEIKTTKLPKFLLKSVIKFVEFPAKNEKEQKPIITIREPDVKDAGVISRNVQEAEKVIKTKKIKRKKIEKELVELEKLDLELEEIKKKELEKVDEQFKYERQPKKPKEEEPEKIKLVIGKGKVPEVVQEEETVKLKKVTFKPQEEEEKLELKPKKEKPEEKKPEEKEKEKRPSLKPFVPTDIEREEPEKLEYEKPEWEKEEKPKPEEKPEKKPKEKKPKPEPETVQIKLEKGIPKKPEPEEEPEVKFRIKQKDKPEEIPETIKLKPFEKPKPEKEEPETELTVGKPKPDDVERPEEELERPSFDIDDGKKKKIIKKIKKKKPEEVPEEQKPEEIVPEKPVEEEKPEILVEEEKPEPVKVPEKEEILEEKPVEEEKPAEELTEETEEIRKKKIIKKIRKIPKEKPEEEQPVVEVPEEEKPKPEEPAPVVEKRKKPKPELIKMEIQESKPQKLQISEPKEEVPLFAQIKLKKATPAKPKEIKKPKMPKFLLKSPIKYVEFPPASESEQKPVITIRKPDVKDCGVVSRTMQEAEKVIKTKRRKLKEVEQDISHLEKLDLEMEELKKKELEKVDDQYKFDKLPKKPEEKEPEKKKLIIGKGKVPEEENELETVKLKKAPEKPTTEEEKFVPKPKKEKPEEKKPEEKEKEKRPSLKPFVPTDIEREEPEKLEYEKPEWEKEEKPKPEEKPEKKPKETIPKPEPEKVQIPLVKGVPKKPEPEEEPEVKFRIKQKDKPEETPETITLKPFEKPKPEKEEPEEKLTVGKPKPDDVERPEEELEKPTFEVDDGKKKKIIKKIIKKKVPKAEVPEKVEEPTPEEPVVEEKVPEEKKPEEVIPEEKKQEEIKPEEIIETVTIKEEKPEEIIEEIDEITKTIIKRKKKIPKEKVKEEEKPEIPEEEKPEEQKPVEEPKPKPKLEKIKPELMTIERKKITSQKLLISEPQPEVPLFAQIKLKKSAVKQKEVAKVKLPKFLLKSNIRYVDFPPASESEQKPVITMRKPDVKDAGVISRNVQDAEKVLKTKRRKSKITEQELVQLEKLDMEMEELKKKELEKVDDQYKFERLPKKPEEQEPEKKKLIIGKGKVPEKESEIETIKLKKVPEKPTTEEEKLEPKKKKEKPVEKIPVDKEEEKEPVLKPFVPTDIEREEPEKLEFEKPEWPEKEKEKPEEKPEKKPKEKKPKPEPETVQVPLVKGIPKKPEPEEEPEVKFRIKQKDKPEETPETITLKPFEKPKPDKEEAEKELTAPKPKPEDVEMPEEELEMPEFKDKDVTKKKIIRKIKKKPEKETPVEEQPAPEEEKPEEKKPEEVKPEEKKPEEPKKVKPEKVKPELMKIERKNITPQKLQISEPKEEVPLFAQIKLKKRETKQKEVKSVKLPKFLLKSTIRFIEFPPLSELEQIPVITIRKPDVKDTGILSRNIKDAEKVLTKKRRKSKAVDEERTELEKLDLEVEELKKKEKETVDEAFKYERAPKKPEEKEPEEPKKLIIGKGKLPEKEPEEEPVKLRKIPEKPTTEEEVTKLKPKKEEPEETKLKKKEKEKRPSLTPFEPTDFDREEPEKMELEKTEWPTKEKEKPEKVEEKKPKEKKPKPEPETVQIPLIKGVPKKPETEEEPEVKFRIPQKDKPEEEPEAITLKPFTKPKDEEEKDEITEITIGKPKTKEEVITEEEVTIKKIIKKKKKVPETEDVAEAVILKKPTPKPEEDVAEELTLKKPQKAPEEEVSEEVVIKKLKPKPKPVEEEEVSEAIVLKKPKPKVVTQEEVAEELTIKKPRPKVETQEEVAEELTIKKPKPKVVAQEEVAEELTIKKPRPKVVPQEEVAEELTIKKPRPKVVPQEDVAEELTIKKPRPKVVTQEEVAEELTIKKPAKPTKVEEEEVSEEIVIKKRKPKEKPTEEVADEFTLKKPAKEQPQDEVAEFTIQKKKPPRKLSFEEHSEEITIKKLKPIRKPSHPDIQEYTDVEEVTFRPRSTKTKEDVEQEFKIQLDSYAEEEISMSEKIKIKKPKPFTYSEETGEASIKITQEIEDDGPAIEEIIDEGSDAEELPYDIEEPDTDKDVEEHVQMTLKRKPKQKPYTVQEFDEEEVQFGIKKPKHVEDYSYEEESLTMRPKRKPKTTTLVQEAVSLSITKEGETIEEEVKELQAGDKFYSICSYIAETDEAINLVEGERVYIIESLNSDWWFVKKNLTEEKGWVPAQYLMDEVTYTMYVQKKLNEKIDKLPVFEKPQPSEKAFAPKFIEKLQPKHIPDGYTIQFECQVEGTPRPQITWFRQTAIIKPSQDFQMFYDEDNVATLIISEVFPEDAGTFTCVAKNAAGFASSTTELIVEAPLSEHGSDMTGLSRRSLSRESSLADIIEGIIPTFSRKPKAQCVDEGEDVTFECRLAAIPEPSISWTHNIKKLTTKENITITTESDMHMYICILKITKVKKNQEGIYEIHAKNREGEATLTINLKVRTGDKEPPQILEPLKSVIVREDEVSIMTTYIVGNPKPKVEWFKNGKPAKKLPVTEENNVYTFTLPNPKMEDTAEYTVKAKNPHGTAETTATLIVEDVSTPKPEPPIFIERFQEQSVKEKGTLKLNARVLGNPVPEVIWLHNNKPLEPSDKITMKYDGENIELIIQNADSETDSGDYKCIATNPDGKASHGAKITVEVENVKFTKKLKKTIEIIERETIKLECETSHSVTTVWYHNEKEISGMDHRVVIQEGKKHKLIVKNATINDTGVYKCVVKDQKTECTVTVKQGKTEFIRRLQDFEVIEKECAILEVEVSSETVPLEWRKDGLTIKETDERYTFQQEGTIRKLLIRSTSIHDEGEYYCALPDEECSAEVTVIELPPEIITKMQDQTIPEGERAMFEIELTKGDALIRWFKDGKELQFSEHIQLAIDGKRQKLKIYNTIMEDAGVYSCVVGEQKSSAKLTVTEGTGAQIPPSKHHEPPKLEIDETLINQTIEINKKWRVDARYKGYPKPEITWMKNGEAITTTERCMIKTDNATSTIMIETVENKDTAVYKISAVNKIATDSKEVKLTVIGRPSPPQGPLDVSGMTATSFTLKWQPSEFDGGSKILEYIVEMKEEGSTRWKKIGASKGDITDIPISNLKKDSAYYFKIYARNDVGMSDAFMPEDKIVAGQRVTPPSSPTNVQVTEFTSRSATIAWGPPVSTGGSEITDYILEKRLAGSTKWEKVVTLEPNVFQHTIENLKEKNEFVFRVFAENAVGLSTPAQTQVVALKIHATVPSPPTAPLEIRCIGPNAVVIEWGIPESDGGAPLQGYNIAIRDIKKTMWMEVGRVPKGVQKFTLRDLQEDHDYLIRIFAKNEVGLSDPLESDEPFKVLPSTEADQEEAKETTDRDPTSFSTETTTSWMREANMDADIQSYARGSLLRRDEYFFRIWCYAQQLFK